MPPSLPPPATEYSGEPISWKSRMLIASGTADALSYIHRLPPTLRPFSLSNPPVPTNLSSDNYNSVPLSPRSSAPSIDPSTPLSSAHNPFHPAPHQPLSLWGTPGEVGAVNPAPVTASASEVPEGTMAVGVNEVMHGDIKSANVYLTADNRAKVSKGQGNAL